MTKKINRWDDNDKKIHSLAFLISKLYTSLMDSVKIKDLTVGDNVTAFYSVRRREIREYSKGKFVSLELGDATGRIQAVVWEPDQFCLSDLDTGMVVKVKGSIGEYQGRKQMTVSLIMLAKDDEYALEDILMHSPQSPEQRKSRILKLTDKVENTYIRQLLESFWNDEEFFEKFLTAAAGKLWHHAYIGGLSEHSANVAELTLRVAQGYDFLNNDYLIFGGLLHDVGKVDTYAVKTSIDYTDQGRLVGHICIADTWIYERAHKIELFPESLLTKLRHLILSHQGEYETPVQPMMPEAFIIYFCDEIDSKMAALDRIRTKVERPGWSDYVKLLERFLYFDATEDIK
ncbi:MAG: OB-fold nucleic acid binding domain-containing protein [bacterium]